MSVDIEEIRKKYRVTEKGDGWALWRHDRRRDGGQARQYGFFSSLAAAEVARSQAIQDDLAFARCVDCIRAAEACEDRDLVELCRKLMRGEELNSGDVRYLLDLAIPAMPYGTTDRPYRTINADPWKPLWRSDLDEAPAAAHAALDERLEAIDQSIAAQDEEVA